MLAVRVTRHLHALDGVGASAAAELHGRDAHAATVEVALLSFITLRGAALLDGEGDDYATDPLLSGRPDLARITRVGDLLRERGRCDAALVEYAKAADPAEPPSPLLLAREASCYEALGDPHKALSRVELGVSLSPGFTLLQTTRGRLLEATGQPREAVSAWQAAHDLNPYDPTVQDALVRGYEAMGDVERARRHLRYARILATGGSPDDG